MAGKKQATDRCQRVELVEGKAGVAIGQVHAAEISALAEVAEVELARQYARYVNM